jgi:hypothetical protein
MELRQHLRKECVVCPRGKMMLQLRRLRVTKTNDQRECSPGGKFEMSRNDTGVAEA